MAERIYINEVGLRDGLQNQPTLLTTADKVALFESLAKTGLRQFEVTSFVSPKLVPQLADAFDLLAAIRGNHSHDLCSLVPNQKGYERAFVAGSKHIAVVLAATEHLNAKNINMSLTQAIEVCEDVTRRAKSDGVRVRAYIAAAFACPYEGPTPPAVVFDLLERMAKAGADELAIADTIGAGNPKQAAELFGRAVGQYGAARVAAHFHDTRGLGTALAWAAAEAGVRHFDASIAGLGGCPFAPGASGNVATEDLVFMFNDTGYDTGVDIERLLESVALAQRLLPAAPGGKIVSWARSRHRPSG